MTNGQMRDRDVRDIYINNYIWNEREFPLRCRRSLSPNRPRGISSERRSFFFFSSEMGAHECSLRRLDGQSH